MEQIFRRAPGPNTRLATQISWQKPRGSPPPKVSTWPFLVAGGGLPGFLMLPDVILWQMFSNPCGRNQIPRTPPIRFYDSKARSREQISHSRLDHEDDGRLSGHCRIFTCSRIGPGHRRAARQALRGQKSKVIDA